MARFFITRAVFAIVLSLIITLVGLIAALTLPIEQYPEIAAPRVSVSANYLGANASVVESTIASTIELGNFRWNQIQLAPIFAPASTTIDFFP